MLLRRIHLGVFRLVRLKTLLIAAGCMALVLAGGCVYRIDIQQGNVVEQEDVEQVEVGMTRSQVQFLLGTPMVSDTFHQDRWDYTYYFRQGRSRNVERRWFIVYFDDDRVARLEHEIQPEPGSAETPPVDVPSQEELERERERQQEPGLPPPESPGF